MLVQGTLRNGGLVPNPMRVGPMVPASKTPTYLQPVHIARMTMIDVAAKDDDAYVLAKTSTALPGAAGFVTFVPDGVIGIGPTPQPRNFIVTVTHASSVVAASGVVSGLDMYGNVISEAWSVTATGTSKTSVGNVAFWKILSVTYVTATNAQANTFKVGTGDKLGLQFATPVASLVKEVSGGSVVTNGVVVAASSSANADRRGTYAPNTVPDASTDYDIYYLVADPSV